MYKEIIKPYYDQQIFICGESFLIIKDGLKVVLETSYDVLEQIKIEDISFKRKIEEKKIKYKNRRR